MASPIPAKAIVARRTATTARPADGCGRHTNASATADEDDHLDDLDHDDRRRSWRSGARACRAAWHPSRFKYAITTLEGCRYPEAHHRRGHDHERNNAGSQEVDTMLTARRQDRHKGEKDEEDDGNPQRDQQRLASFRVIRVSAATCARSARSLILRARRLWFGRPEADDVPPPDPLVVGQWRRASAAGRRPRDADDLPGDHPTGDHARRARRRVRPPARE